MATKKQKRAEGLAKREAYLAEIKESGLAAQEYDRKVQEERRRRLMAIGKEINDGVLAGLAKAFKEPTTQELDTLAGALKAEEKS